VEQSDRGLLGKIHGLRAASRVFRIPEKLMEVARRASDHNSLLSSNKVPLLTREQIR